MSMTIVGVMCQGDAAHESAVQSAFELGKLIAQHGWVLLSGGRKKGAMDAVNKGAKSANGLTVGIILTSNNDDTSDFVDIAVITGMGGARNNINVLSCDALIVIADGIGPGTVSEAALALKAKKNIVLLNADEVTTAFFQKLQKTNVSFAQTPQEAVTLVKRLVG